jgi:hypothetical protein
MGRFNQRRFRQYSELGGVVVDEPINNLSYNRATVLSLADVNRCGFWLNDGAVLGCTLPFPAVGYAIDAGGNFVTQVPAGGDSFGEYYSGIITDYSNQACNLRVLRSEMLIEYQMLDGMAGASQQMLLRALNPQVGLADVYNFSVLNTSAPITTLTETTVALGLVGAAFSSEMDAGCNKIKISCVRTAAGVKTITVNWWDRALAAMQTAVLNHAAPGAGDVPIMWFFNANVGNRVMIKRLETSSSPIVYGGAPV